MFRPTRGLLAKTAATINFKSRYFPHAQSTHDDSCLSQRSLPSTILSHTTIPTHRPFFPDLPSTPISLSTKCPSARFGLSFSPSANAWAPGQSSNKVTQRHFAVALSITTTHTPLHSKSLPSTPILPIDSSPAPRLPSSPMALPQV